MVIVLKGSERAQYPEYFNQHFRLRHEIFVKRRGWSLPSANGFEIDQYDNEHALYFLDLNEDDVIEGSIRLTPTEKSSLLADYFPHLVENGTPPRSPSIYECTRYIVMPVNKSRDGNRAAKSRVIGAMLEWSLRNKVTFLQTVIETSTLSSYLELTPQTIPLGLSHPYGGGRDTPGGGECMAIRWPVTLQVIEDIRAYGGLGPHPHVFAEAERAGIRTPVGALH
jgi:acyl-homoserine lactone synthase